MTWDKEIMCWNIYMEDVYLVHLRKIHEDLILRRNIAFVSFIIYKSTFLHFHHKGDLFYKNYINLGDKHIYIYDYGTCITPQQHYINKFRGKIRCYGSKIYKHLYTYCDKTVKRKIENVGGKIKPTVFIYLPVSQFCQSKISFKMRLCLHYAVINATTYIRKFFNENLFYW